MYQLEPFMAELERKNPAQPEFIQAVREVVESVIDMVNDNPVYQEEKILERITEPDRVIMFRVDWEDDQGRIQTNRGYRVQFNNAIGPYKGGLRFHSSVTLGSLKFLGFEQTFKNSLTTLPMGGGKGGSDFNPRGKSDAEIQRFCRSFMTELQKYIGPDTDVPAGDIGVGAREIGYLYGQYKRIRGENTGVLTGKGLGYGGSLIRPEATGFGTMYFADELLKEHHDEFTGKRVSLSGFGNVAWGAAMKASQLGAKVVTISGPDGYVLDEKGVGSPEKWEYMQRLRASNQDVVAPYARQFGAKFVPGKKPWEVPVDMAFTCAIQNELSLEDAKQLVANGVKYVVETSNMGCQADAVKYFIDHRIPFAPGKAANAGGVAVSGLEMSQNAMHLSWSAEEVDEKLHGIMRSIHDSCVREGRQEDGYINYVKGANIAGFRKVADAMVQLGY
ncbi:MAG: NADP-specific glutamate dehydrogenase [Sphaerochaeta sp.]|jgi:glutamate dehydrogenase (NADP+)|nr:NADP-specific glutamate dehydrogenase [Sphaerochaeta sp.]MCH3919522.1 NADP-specific glutamate dehydrogenase [Sphaerochaeta sp.]MCI2045885.1 NADP-specific glutamate dehydrogenase [Sphaerochaeta sp.]MCI2097578.1 NADP-specific glutamate dehydrogenase [Sphaerochaeta sp.]MCI2104494.1 NADP-specific glutamate dehydrogenase [Sphaerochaeta sp.]